MMTDGIINTMSRSDDLFLTYKDIEQTLSLLDPNPNIEENEHFIISSPGHNHNSFDISLDFTENSFVISEIIPNNIVILDSHPTDSALTLTRIPFKLTSSNILPSNLAEVSHQVSHQFHDNECVSAKIEEDVVSTSTSQQPSLATKQHVEQIPAASKSFSEFIPTNGMTQYEDIINLGLLELGSDSSIRIPQQLVDFCLTKTELETESLSKDSTSTSTSTAAATATNSVFALKLYHDLQLDTQSFMPNPQILYNFLSTMGLTRFSTKSHPHSYSQLHPTNANANARSDYEQVDTFDFNTWLSLCQKFLSKEHMEHINTNDGIININPFDIESLVSEPDSIATADFQHQHQHQLPQHQHKLPQHQHQHPQSYHQFHQHQH